MKADESLHVLTLADAHYAMPLAVMVRSLLENHRSGRSLTIKVVDGGMSPELRGRLERSWQGASSSPAQWEFIAPVYSNARELPVWGRVPVLTYARLTIGEYFGHDVSRVVVLDSDTLVLTDITRLHDVDLAGAILAATVDPFIRTVSSIDGLAEWRQLGLAPDEPYFNAGIMAVDLARWREARIGELTLDYIARAHRSLRQYDQDGLNAVLAGRWMKLDPRWQIHPRVKNALGGTVPSDAWIVHFSGRLKPWLYAANTSPDRLFFEYLDRTDWRGLRPPTDVTAAAYRLYDSGLRRVLYPLETRLSALKRAVDKLR
jgi:lipopolysaccharide biosynthesis glycosyltransferase